jgi:hypothetical protein
MRTLGPKSTGLGFVGVGRAPGGQEGGIEGAPGWLLSIADPSCFVLPAIERWIWRYKRQSLLIKFVGQLS